MKKLIFSFLLLGAFSYANAQQPVQRGMGLRMDAEAKTQYNRVKQAPLLTKAGIGTAAIRVNLKNYCPPVQDQGNMGTCTAWATGYYIHGILDAVAKNQKNPSRNDTYAPMWIYEQIKEKSDINCSEGSFINRAFELLQNSGDIKYNQLDYNCGVAITQRHRNAASSNKIKEFQALFADYSSPNKIEEIKKSLANNRPAAIAWGVTPSFTNIIGDTWIRPNQESVRNIQGYHAMAVVGYDDEKNGGSFLLVNSWGTGWGDNGFAWVKYPDFQEFAFYAFEAVPTAIRQVDNGGDGGNNKIKLGLKASFRQLGGNTMGVKKVVPPTSIDIGGGIKSSTQTNYIFDKSYSSGTQFQFSCDVKAQSYVYVLASDQENIVTKAFPLNDSFSALIPYGNSQFVFPSPDHYLYLDDNKGKEFICFLVSHQEINFDDLVSKIKRQNQGEFIQKVKSALGSRLLETGMTYKEGVIDFEVELEEANNKVALIVVELDHK